MKAKQLIILTVIAAAAMGATVWFMIRKEQARKNQVLVDNYAAVDHFEAYGGGF